MKIQIQLNHRNAIFTNGDTVSGVVLVQCTPGATAGRIVITLRGCSESVTSCQTGLSRKRRESHQILHSEQILRFGTEHKGHDKCEEAMIIRKHFDFKMPLQNSCSHSTHGSLAKSIADRFRLDASDTLPQILPPSLDKLVDGIGITYSLSAIAKSENIFRQSARDSVEIQFQPFDPRFAASVSSPNSITERAVTLETTDTLAFASPETSPRHRPRIMIKTELPPQATLTCGKILPLGLLVEKLTPTPQTLILQSLQVMIKWRTWLQARGTEQEIAQSYVLRTLSRVGLELGSTSDPTGTTYRINPELWQHDVLPCSVVPSFRTCNIARAYHLEVLLGLQYGHNSPVMHIQLEIPITLWSGISLDRNLSVGRPSHRGSDGALTNSYDAHRPPPKYMESLMQTSTRVQH